MSDIIKNWKPQLENENPDVVVMVIGDNDVSRMLDMLFLAKVIVNRARKIVEMTGARVAIVQLCPRYEPELGYRGRWGYDETYNECASFVNEEIKRQIVNDEKLLFWSHASLAFPGERFDVKNMKDRYEVGQELYLQDGVHLSDAGQCALYRSFRNLLKRNWQSLKGRQSIIREMVYQFLFNFSHKLR